MSSVLALQLKFLRYSTLLDHTVLSGNLELKELNMNLFIYYMAKNDYIQKTEKVVN